MTADPVMRREPGGLPEPRGARRPRQGGALVLAPCAPPRADGGPLGGARDARRPGRDAPLPVGYATPFALDGSISVANNLINRHELSGQTTNTGSRDRRTGSSGALVWGPVAARVRQRATWPGDQFHVAPGSRVKSVPGARPATGVRAPAWWHRRAGRSQGLKAFNRINNRRLEWRRLVSGLGRPSQVVARVGAGGGARLRAQHARASAPGPRPPEVRGLAPASVGPRRAARAVASGRPRALGEHFSAPLSRPIVERSNLVRQFRAALATTTRASSGPRRDLGPGRLGAPPRGGQRHQWAGPASARAHTKTQDDARQHTTSDTASFTWRRLARTTGPASAAAHSANLSG